MAISTQVSTDNKTLIISISGNFDINAYHKFGESYKDKLQPDMNVVIDLAETEYMDSSSLGMLLMLRERVGSDDSQIEIKNCSPGIKKILATANFDKLFKME